MAGAIIIASAIGILLLMFTGYVLGSATLASADSFGLAQKDMVQKKEEQRDTSLEISSATIRHYAGQLHNFTFNLRNNGSAPIGDFSRMDMFIAIPPDYTTVRLTFNGIVNNPGNYTLRTWGYQYITFDTTHPYMLDPNETMNIDIGDSGLNQHDPFVVNVTTPNGITAVGRGS